MERRHFFGLLAGSAAALDAAKSLCAELPEAGVVHVPSLEAFVAAWKSSPTLNTLSDQFEEPYAKWAGRWRDGRGGVGWTGWKCSVDSAILAAQWLLAVERDGSPFRRVRSDKRYFVSATPGAVCEYLPGANFDISVRPGQPYLTYPLHDEPAEQVWAAAVASKVTAYRALEAFVRTQL